MIAILDPGRSFHITRWIGNYLSGMDTNRPLHGRMKDREQVQRLAITGAALLRECCQNLELPPIHEGHREVYADMIRTLADKFAEFFTTSLSALQEVVRIVRMPVQKQAL